MGKKIKKDDKSPAEDVFDPLLVESKQAETVVLMLESPEDDIQSKACEAIYKFVKKCDENKKILLDLNACDPLLKLIVSEEKVVRRNSVMAFAMMTGHADVKKVLTQQPIVVPTLLKLLNPEEFSTTHEFATLALANLCSEYTNIAAILDQKGLEPLVDCIKSDDPDVQRNAVDCISLILQDFEARSALKEVDGLEPMLSLLHSEFPVIQELALQAFIRASQDVGVRSSLCEMEALRQFVDIIGRPEMNDLHVLALQVIANCLDDIDCAQQMKESGGLARLMAFITDVQPAEDEQKTDKAKKGAGGGGKGSAKKKKGDDDAKAKDEEKVPSHTLPEVKIYTCRALMRASRNADNRKVLHEAEAERMLILLLGHEEETVRTASALAVAVMAESALSQDTVAKLEGLEPLVKLTRNDHREPKEAGALALANLTTANLKICKDVADLHGIEALIGCLSVDHERIAGNALSALTNMSTDEGLRAKVLQLGLVKGLIQPLNSVSTMVQTKVALAVSAFVVDSQSRADFRTLNGIEPLVGLLRSNHAEVRRAACWAVANLGTDPECASVMYRCGAVEILQAINKSETKRNAFSINALHRLYDNNLTTKYALTGYLDFTDRTGDEFFDPGQLRPDSQLKPLEDYGMEAINTRRPILLVNTRPPKPVTPMSSTEMDFEIKAPDAKIPTKRTNSRGPKSKTQKGGKRDKDSGRSAMTGNAVPPVDNPSTPVIDDNLEPPVTVRVYTAPDDPALLRFIDDVRTEIQPLTSTRAQIEMLGLYVADKLGGPIERGQLMTFSYELPISQLKTALKSNVIPLGLITTGIHIHRALLFKVLADRIGMPVNLVRGEYNRAWNQIWLPSDTNADARTPPKLYIIDLVHRPGTLLPMDSVDAANYMKI